MKVVISTKTYNLKVNDVIKRVENMDIIKLQKKKRGYLFYIRKYCDNNNVSRKDKIKLEKLRILLQKRLHFGIRPVIH